jgi:large subunit ribosomal protein L23
LQKPRITEKAAIVADKDNVYTFNIAPDATKLDVKKAIEKIYKVAPIKVAITKIPTKKVQVRGQRGKFGSKNGGKKAYVYLKKGDKIDFV